MEAPLERTNLLAVGSEFVVENADYPDWDAHVDALVRHVTYRNGEQRYQRFHRPRTPTPHRCLSDDVPVRTSETGH